MDRCSLPIKVYTQLTISNLSILYNIPTLPSPLGNFSVRSDSTRYDVLAPVRTGQLGVDSTCNARKAYRRVRSKR